MDTTQAIQIVRAFYGLGSGAYLVTILFIFYVYLRLRDPFVRRVLVLAILGCSYSLLSLGLTLGPFSVDTSTLLFPMIAFFGSMTYAIYLDVLTEFLGISHRVFKWTSRSLKITALALLSTAPFAVFVKPGGVVKGNWMMDYVAGSVHITEPGMLVLGYSALISLFSTLFLCFGYWSKFREDKLLTFGILFTLFATISDNLMGMGVPYLFSIYAFGFLFEVLRFTIHAFELDFLKRQELVNHFQMNLTKQSENQLIRQFVHDLGACLRQNKSLTSLQSRVQEVSKLYGRLGKEEQRLLGDPQKGFSLLETVYRNQRPDLEILVQKKEGLAPLGLSSTDFFIVFGNLLQNSIDVLSKSDTSKIYVEFEQGDGEALIRYRDLGPGFTKEAKSSAFRAGFSTKGEGRGQGLNIVRETLFNYGARVEVLSPARGSQILISIPMPS